MTNTTKSTTGNTVTKKNTKREINKRVSFDEIRQQLIITTFEVIQIYEVDSGKNRTKTGALVNEIPEKEINREVSEESFSMSEISKEDISTYRRSNIPSFILKTNGKYYHTTITPNLKRIIQNKSWMSTMCTHMCGECDRLSAASDENGGCAKVRDYHDSYIERYDWILEGYETFNVPSPSFVVSKCTHYAPYPPRPQRTTEEINRMKLSLAQFMWDDVQSLAEVRERKRKYKHQ